MKVSIATTVPAIVGALLSGCGGAVSKPATEKPVVSYFEKRRYYRALSARLPRPYILADTGGVANIAETTMVLGSPKFERVSIRCSA